MMRLSAFHRPGRYSRAALHKIVVAAMSLLMSGMASAQEIATTSAELPRDLSPWGMFQSADLVVKAVMVGLLFASIVTWTVWLAKTIELLFAKRAARKALQTLSTARSLDEAARELGRSRDVFGEFVRAAILELQMSADSVDRDGIRSRI